MAVALGIWFLVIELHENEHRWRKTAGVAIFHGDIPPVPQYMPGDVPRYAESPFRVGGLASPRLLMLVWLCRRIKLGLWDISLWLE